MVPVFIFLIFKDNFIEKSYARNLIKLNLFFYTVLERTT